MNYSTFRKGCLLMIALSPLNSFGDYSLEKGSQYELCNEFLNYLNRHEEKELNCELKPDPQFENFRIPQWNLLDAKRFESTILTWNSFSNEGKSYKEDNELNFKAYIANGAMILRSSIMDLNHDGKSEKIFAFTAYQCPIEFNGTAYVNFAVDEEGNFVDKLGAGVRGNPFWYKGRVFIAVGDEQYFRVTEPSIWNIYSNNRSTVPLNSVCEFSLKKLINN